MRKFISGRILVNEGVRLPKFYLPVRKPAEMHGIECWIFFLAPFVWLYYVVVNVFWCVWRDMIDLLADLELFNKLKSPSHEQNKRE